MNKLWYDIDVKKEVLNELENYLEINGWQKSIITKFQDISVRNLMDIEYLNDISEIVNKELFARYVTELYYKYRKLKYGQRAFWNSAYEERLWGDGGCWDEYIINMINKWCMKGSNVLFVGTADGSEIPFSDYYSFYALEQIRESVKQIDEKKVQKVVLGDFEDENLIVEKEEFFPCIVALRCLMPNTRINKFLEFVEKNLSNNGCLVVSHPRSYLDKNGKIRYLADYDKKKRQFEKRLKKEIIDKKYIIVHEAETEIEYFYILKRNKSEE